MLHCDFPAEDTHELLLGRAMQRHLEELSNATPHISSKLLLRELNIDMKEDGESQLTQRDRKDTNELRLPPVKVRKEDEERKGKSDNRIY